MDHDKDILISRIVDREATLEDWAVLKALADADPSIWFQLAQAQQDQQALAAGLAIAIQIADGIDAPSEAAFLHRFSRRMSLVGSWGGWAAAAMIAIALFLRPYGADSPTPNTAGPSLPPLTSASDAYERYLDLGRREGAVLGEVPRKFLVNTFPRENGDGYEVIYIRQIVERAVVPELYRFGSDELGRPAPVKIEWRTHGDPM